MNILSSDHDLTEMEAVRNAKTYKRCDPFLQVVHNLTRELGLRAQVSREVRLSAGHRMHTC